MTIAVQKHAKLDMTFLKSVFLYFVPHILARIVEDINNEEIVGNFPKKKTVIDKWNGFYNYKSDKQKSFMLSGKVIIIHLKCELKKRDIV